MIALVYLDDLLITESNEKLMIEAKDGLHKQFKMKDLGELKYFLGIEVLWSASAVILNQRKYILEVIIDVGLTGANPISAPIESNLRLTLVEHDLLTSSTVDAILHDITPYQRLIGKLLYATITRPYMSYAVQTLSQFMQSSK